MAVRRSAGYSAEVFRGAAPMNQRNDLTLSVHGVGVRIRSDRPAILGAAEHDFSFFAAPIEDADFEIECLWQAPDYDGLPTMTSSMATPRNICYRGADATYMDYRGRALSVYRPDESRCTIFTDDEDLAHEIVYLTLLSRLSDLLGRRGMHRIHALGLETAGRGVIIAMPSGGGKTTLALNLLGDADGHVRLISEDSPLIRRDGMLLPFPLRIGVAPGTVPPEVDPAMTRHIRRMEYDAKVTIDIRCFPDRVCPEPVSPVALLVGERSTGKEARVTRISRASAIRHHLMNSVVGVGLYQGMEFVMHRGIRGLLSHAGVAASRAWNNARLMKRCRVYRFTVGRDAARNLAVLKEFLGGL
jgi:hypothetical protein